MTTVLLVLQLLVTLAMIGVVLIQRSEGGGLGIGASQGMGAFMSGRGTANLLTRATAILATLFMALSLILAVMNRGTSGVGNDILDLPRTADHASAAHPHPLRNAATHPGTLPAEASAPAPGTAAPATTSPAHDGAAPSGAGGPAVPTTH